jgi:hypothetical protein
MTTTLEMEKVYQFIHQQELEHRLAYQSFVNGGGKSVSEKWLTLLFMDLENAGESETELCQAMCQAADCFKDDESTELFDRVSWELARIPVGAKAVWQNGTQWFIEIQEDEQLIRTELGSREAPVLGMPDYILDRFYTGRRLQLFYLPDQLQRAGLEVASRGMLRKERNVKTWDFTDSLVHWIMEFAKSQGASTQPNIRKRETEEGTQWIFYLPSKDRIRKQLTPIQNILRFIRHQKEVSTQQLLYIKYCQDRRTYDILRELQRRDKIEKVGHGRYAIVEANRPSEPVETSD